MIIKNAENKDKINLNNLIEKKKNEKKLKREKNFVGNESGKYFKSFFKKFNIFLYFLLKNFLRNEK